MHRGGRTPILIFAGALLLSGCPKPPDGGGGSTTTTSSAPTTVATTTTTAAPTTTSTSTSTSTTSTTTSTTSTTTTTTTTPPGSFGWSRIAGGTGDERAESVAVDGNGNVTLAGKFANTVDFGTGPLVANAFPWGDPYSYFDAYVAHYDANGVIQWARRFGGVSTDTASAVATLSNGDIIVAGITGDDVEWGDGTTTSCSCSNGDFVLARYRASDGAIVWRKQLGGDGADDARGVAIDGNDNILVTGSFQRIVNFGGANLTNSGGRDSLESDVYVAKYAADGTHVWSRGYGSTTSEKGWAIATDAAGNIVVGGRFAGTVTFGALPVVNGFGDNDGYVAKLDTAGTPLWAKAVGGSSFDEVRQVAYAPMGDVVAVGSFQGAADLAGQAVNAVGGTDAFVVQLTAGGARRWAKAAGGTGTDAAAGVATTSTGDVVLTGNFGTTINFGGGALTSAGGSADMYLARLAGGTGAQVWARRYGAIGGQYGIAVAMRPSDNAPVIGASVNGTINFGNGVLTANTGTAFDTAVAVVAP